MQSLFLIKLYVLVKCLCLKVVMGTLAASPISTVNRLAGWEELNGPTQLTTIELCKLERISFNEWSSTLLCNWSLCQSLLRSIQIREQTPDTRQGNKENLYLEESAPKCFSIIALLGCTKTEGYNLSPGRFIMLKRRC